MRFEFNLQIFVARRRTHNSSHTLKFIPQRDAFFCIFYLFIYMRTLFNKLSSSSQAGWRVESLIEFHEIVRVYFIRAVF